MRDYLCFKPHVTQMSASIIKVMNGWADLRSSSFLYESCWTGLLQFLKLSFPWRLLKFERCWYTLNLINTSHEKNQRVSNLANVVATQYRQSQAKNGMSRKHFPRQWLTWCLSCYTNMLKPHFSRSLYSLLSLGNRKSQSMT